MRYLNRTTAAVVISASLLAPAAAADETSWTGGHTLPPGTQVPFEPGYATQWRSYDVVKWGDPNFRNQDVRGVRVIGQFNQDSILCLENAKAGMWGCYVDGKEATELSYMPYGKVVTTDPMVNFFAPVIRFFLGFQARLGLSNLLAGSSQI
ncbi:hypothetical protein QQO25_05570 [Corynebacterium lehmanniae]|nr:hypothetical protein [Corynebacterium lehmanniae]